MTDQDNIYREDLMEEYKHPQNRGKIASPTIQILEKNPMCGDEVNLQLKIEDGKIMDAKFDGSACMVSIVSSSKLTQEIIGKSIAEVKKLTKEDLLELIGLNLTTSRVKCATLSLDALNKALASIK
jgi:nitrogen fixation NifU-like protein